MIHVARDEESDASWVWVGGATIPNIDERTVVRIKHNAHRRPIYVEARVMDDNYRRKYNDPASGRIRIDPKQDSIVMGEWYRRGLGIAKNNLTELSVKNFNVFGAGALFAACQSPNAVVRLGMRLGMLGFLLGLLAVADPALKVVEQLSSMTEFYHAWAMIVIALFLAIIGYFLCRGRPKP